MNLQVTKYTKFTVFLHTPSRHVGEERRGVATLIFKLIEVSGHLYVPAALPLR
jgi:hypothetical protein